MLRFDEIFLFPNFEIILNFYIYKNDTSSKRQKTGIKN